MSRRTVASDQVERAPVRLDISKILEILPQRYPFVLVDRVTDVIAGESARGHKMVTHGELWSPGHFPRSPVMPGLLVLEALAQLAGILAYVSEPFDPSRSQLYLLGIDKAKLRHRVIPGDRLDLAVSVAQHRSNTWKFDAEATVDDTLCARAEFMASVVDRND
jgi:3-hydroxyacyl-[acyl-carrier-protein] dehydratase